MPLPKSKVRTWESEDGGVRLYCGDCLEILPTLPDWCVDTCVTDPPYGLEFMGKEWDRLRNDWQAKPGTYHNDTTFLPRGDRIRYQAGSEAQAWHLQWSAALLSILPQAAYAIIFGGTRTYHRLACAVEDAGFEIRDCLMWLYGSGFPKAKSCLKPAYEPILLCRKPGGKVLPLGIDECRVGVEERTYRSASAPGGNSVRLQDVGDGKGGDGRNLKRALEYASQSKQRPPVTATGRWPANILHDGSEEVLEAFAAFGERKAGIAVGRNASSGSVYGGGKGLVSGPKGEDCLGYGDTGTAARFFYCAKASRRERGKGNIHPTVKPLALMEHLVKLACPSGATVLDPFLGSATTGVACMM